MEDGCGLYGFRKVAHEGTGDAWIARNVLLGEPYEARHVGFSVCNACGKVEERGSHQVAVNCPYPAASMSKAASPASSWIAMGKSCVLVQ